jgi:hypothetical protein
LPRWFPPGALALLIAIDLGLSGGSYLTGSLLRATDSSQRWELASRRYELAGRIVTSANNAAYLPR